MKRVLILFVLVTLTGVITTPELSSGYVKDKFNFSVVFTGDSPYVYKDNKGHTVVIGEVQNTSDVYSVRDVHIDANFYDDVNSNPLETVEGGTISDVIPPLGKSYYMISSNSPNPHITQASVSMEGFNGADPKSKQLSIELSNIVLDSTLRFSGVMKNNGVSANNANVYLAFYDNSIPLRVISVSSIPIGNIEPHEIKKISFNEEFQTRSIGFFLFSESDVSYSDPVNFTLEPFLDVNSTKPSEHHINYEIYGRQFFDNPLVCVDPPNWAVSKNEKQKINGLSENARIAVQYWQSALQENEKEELKDNWKMDFKILTEQNKEKNLQKNCNVIIQFEDRPSEQDEWFQTLGTSNPNYDNTGINLIKIYFNSIQTCVTQDDRYIYYDPCYDYNIFRTPKQLQGTIMHEIGHTLGLGHYVADDPKINEAWKKGILEEESIMTMISYDNQNLREIKPIDVTKIKSIYTPNGFKFVSEDQIDSESKLLLEPKYSDQHMIPNWVKQNAKWWAEDKMDNSDFIYGIQFLIKEQIIKVTTKTTSTEIPTEIPSWIKSNAKWWAEDKISNEDFIKGLEYLVENRIIQVD